MIDDVLRTVTDEQGQVVVQRGTPMGAEVTRILLADDHTLYREGLRALFSHWDDFEIVAEAENGAEAVELCRIHQPDIVLMDVQMPVMDGVEATRLIHEEFPQIDIVMLTMTIEESSLFESIKYGARGYILKDMPARQLGDRLRGVVKGEAVLSGPVTARILEEFSRIHESGAQQQQSDALSASLTESEAEILRLVARGLSNEEIAAELYMSEGAVKKKLSALLTKLHINNRIQAAAYAVRVGLAD